MVALNDVVLIDLTFVLESSEKSFCAFLERNDYFHDNQKRADKKV